MAFTMVIYNSIVILKKLIIVSILASASWSQDLTLKMNDKTATITQNQPIEIILNDNDVYKGRFLKIEKNNIIVEGSYYGSLLTIPFNQVKE